MVNKDAGIAFTPLQCSPANAADHQCFSDLLTKFLYELCGPFVQGAKNTKKLSRLIEADVRVIGRDNVCLVTSAASS